MIEINLKPQEEPGRRARARTSSPNGSRSRKASPWLAAACVPGLVGLLTLALLQPGSRERRRSLEARIDEAARDSTELTELIATAERLRAGRDSVSARMEVIHELDRGRYVWSRLLDEVADAVPEFTWLTRIVEAEGGDGARVEIEGRTANTFALTRFMNRLEAAPSLTSVRLAGTEQVVEPLPGGGEWVLSSFVLWVGHQP